MKFTPAHEWIRMEGSSGKVGITEYARGELGKIVFVELPEVGKEVRAGEGVCVVESSKAAIDIASPVSGHITEVNQELQAEPEMINHSAEEKGWLYKIALTVPQELELLMSRTQYHQLLGIYQE